MRQSLMDPSGLPATHVLERRGTGPGTGAHTFLSEAAGILSVGSVLPVIRLWAKEGGREGGVKTGPLGPAVRVLRQGPGSSGQQPWGDCRDMGSG